MIDGVYAGTWTFDFDALPGVAQRFCQGSITSEPSGPASGSDLPLRGTFEIQASAGCLRRTGAWTGRSRAGGWIEFEPRTGEGGGNIDLGYLVGCERLTGDFELRGPASELTIAPAGEITADCMTNAGIVRTRVRMDFVGRL